MLTPFCIFLISMIQFNTDPRIHDCEPEWQWISPTLSDYDYWLILSGQGTLFRGKEKQRLDAGSSFVFFPGEAPRATHDPDRPLRVLAFHFQHCADPLPPPDSLPAYRRIRELNWMELLAREAEWPPLGTRSAKRRAELAAGSLLALHVDASDQLQDDQERLHLCARAIQRAPGLKRSVAELAQSCGMSEGHFSRSFRQEFGLPPARYRLLARLERAKQLLRESPLSLAEIAEATGFGDEWHFSHRFKRECGLPPGRYRRQSSLDKRS